MKFERSVLVSFFGNYVVNNVVAALVALIPAGAATGILTPQYITFVVLAAITVGLFTWWYGARDLKDGAIFGLVGFVISLLTAFVTGIAGVLAQTGSLSQMFAVIPNFGPFLASMSTLVLLGYWVIPAVAVGYFAGRTKAAPAPMRSTMPPQTPPQQTM
jgi:hypothetical protein